MRTSPEVGPDVFEQPAISRKERSRSEVYIFVIFDLLVNDDLTNILNYS
jgi:hypothetical protein